MSIVTPVANLLRIVFYGGGLLSEAEDPVEHEVGVDDGANFVELIARMVANAGLRIRRGGYQRGYFEQEECSARPRGRLQLARSFALGAVQRARMWSTFDEFGDDTPDNRVLLAVLEFLGARALREEIDAATRADLTLLRDDLTAVARVRLDRSMLDQLPQGMVARRYRVVRYCARLLVELGEPDDVGAEGWAARLHQDERLMRRVFERFVYRFAKFHRPDGVALGRGSWAWSDVAMAQRRMPRLVPDAVLRSAIQVRVVECKYTRKVFEQGPHGAKETLRSSHLQQLFSYLARESARERDHGLGKAVCGLLLYPHAGKPVRVETRLGDFPVVVTTLDLSRPWPELKHALRNELRATF